MSGRDLPEIASITDRPRELPMRTLHVNRVLFAALLCLCMTVPAFPAMAADKSTEDGQDGADRALRPWIMVSLSPSGCSRGCKHVFSVVGELSGNRKGKIVHFSELTPELVGELRPAFIILSPQGTPWCRYSGEDGVGLQNFLWTLPMLAEKMDIPILGICGGHQALALAFGGKVGPIRGGEDDCMPYTSRRQGGIIMLRPTAQDPIFKGIDGQMLLVSSHYDEVKQLPPGFVLLASDNECPVQIMRHPSRPVYGIQGHPEQFRSTRPDGWILLRNFIRIAETHNQAIRKLQPEVPPSLMSLRR